MTQPVPPFVGRHVGPSDTQTEEMLAVVGAADLESLITSAIPAEIRNPSELAIEPAPSEQAVLAELREIADRNKVVTSMIGMGYYGTHTPAVIKRNILENPAWYTAYTPYQPEISQGRLEALMNFQTMLIDLTGLEIANASMLDEGTAAAEAMTLMRRAAKAKDGAVLVVDTHLLPQTSGVIRTRAQAMGIECVEVDLTGVDTADALSFAVDGKPVFGVIVQYPGADGEVRDFRALADAVHALGGYLTAAADILALTLLEAPGTWGADVAVGTTQRFGVPMGFGGPHAGYMAVHEKVSRQMPGRLVGLSVDAEGHPGYRLALQTREQHIRREKATSNICTAQVLLAVMASMYAVYHGPQGLKRIALHAHSAATALAEALKAGGVEVLTTRFFDTITVKVPGKAREIAQASTERGVNICIVDDDHLRMSADETTQLEHLEAVCGAFGVTPPTSIEELDSADFGACSRTTDYLTHEVFNAVTSETQMLRYMRTLADRDYALDRGMIPLGSCTMKLNATTEMEAITWPEFAALHPFAPADQTQGIRDLVTQLSEWLVEITGYDAVSVQPNAGSAGELAGLMAIRAYHIANGDHGRDVCLIPSSAHGTNAASAAMAGLQVAVVKSMADGSIDMDDLRAKIEKHGERIAAVMVTYPSTHGVYEDTITELCGLVHDAGGQVYVDGANMNALVGIARPGKFGADVSHLNLHKTFTIPHGGGGPGVGPIGVRAHLAPHLPNHPLAAEAGPESGVGPIASAPFGSASILPISWAYIRLMGGAGLEKATKMAVLNANYIAKRLDEHFPVLYTGKNGRVAHECILDLREITKISGVTVDDVAKRLIDYGFHAPTMSFPVAGTLMVEPTESEDKGEIDRFCDAMIAIRAEIQEIVDGKIAVENSALRGAPHTAYCLTGEWDKEYDRATAVYPQGVDPRSKYWPATRRIDGAYGDRNLICTCPPPEAFDMQD